MTKNLSIVPSTKCKGIQVRSAQCGENDRTVLYKEIPEFVPSVFLVQSKAVKHRFKRFGYLPICQEINGNYRFCAALAILFQSS
jgi:hypothetical protein